MAYLGNSPLNRLYSARSVTLGQGQTAVNVSYTPGLVLFFKNGALLEPVTDYTAIDGSVVTLTNPASAGDVLQVVSLAQFAVANAVPLSGGVVGGPLTGPASASEADAGLIKIATTALALALADDETALTPKKLADVLADTALGRSQTVQDMTGSRALNVTYTNTSGRPIFVWAVGKNVGGGDTTTYLDVDGVSVSVNTRSSAGEPSTHYAIVPNGSTYHFSSPGNTLLNYWFELR